MARLHDMHCHLDFMENALEVAIGAQRAGMAIFANTVSPEGWLQARDQFGPMDNVAVGFGLHPWWVESGDAERATELLQQHDPRFVGEIGLDHGDRHAHNALEQHRAFEAVMHWAAERGGKLLSIHSVHAASDVLDVIEATGASESCDCVFHWFTGPSDQLKRAVNAGCYFSFGKRSLVTRKGREYARIVPLGRILLETDAPPQQGQAYSPAELHADLQTAADALVSLRGPESLDLVAGTAERLLFPHGMPSGAQQVQ